VPRRTCNKNAIRIASACGGDNVIPWRNVCRYSRDKEIGCFVPLCLIGPIEVWNHRAHYPAARHRCADSPFDSSYFCGSPSPDQVDWRKAHPLLNFRQISVRTLQARLLAPNLQP
jgi:hypothetical protein